MQTHFYNYEDFVNLNPNETTEFIIDTIAGDNASKTSLYDQVTTIEIDVKDENDNIIKHNLYYHVIREGSGSNPTIADSIYVSYKGFLFNNKTFILILLILLFRFFENTKIPNRPLSDLIVYSFHPIKQLIF